MEGLGNRVDQMEPNLLPPKAVPTEWKATQSQSQSPGAVKPMVRSPRSGQPLAGKTSLRSNCFGVCRESRFDVSLNHAIDGFNRSLSAPESQNVNRQFTGNERLKAGEELSSVKRCESGIKRKAEEEFDRMYGEALRSLRECRVSESGLKPNEPLPGTEDVLSRALCRNKRKKKKVTSSTSRFLAKIRGEEDAETSSLSIDPLIEAMRDFDPKLGEDGKKTEKKEKRLKSKEMGDKKEKNKKSRKKQRKKLAEAEKKLRKMKSDFDHYNEKVEKNEVLSASLEYKRIYLNRIRVELTVLNLEGKVEKDKRNKARMVQKKLLTAKYKALQEEYAVLKTEKKRRDDAVERELIRKSLLRPIAADVGANATAVRPLSTETPLGADLNVVFQSMDINRQNVII